MNKKTKIFVGYPQNFAISFFLFFITFNILSILDTPDNQFLCGVQGSKKDFFRVKKDFLF